MRLRVTGDPLSGKLLGAQIAGHWRSEVSKRIDIFATALFHGMQVEALNELDLSYTPPLSSPWDPVQMSAQAWLRAQVEIGNGHKCEKAGFRFSTPEAPRSQTGPGPVANDSGQRTMSG